MSRGPLLLPCLRGVMGDWVYYLSTLTGAQLAARVDPAHSIRETKRLEDFLQRKLKPRVEKIARYLSTEETRFFNAMIVGVFDTVPQWFPLALHEPKSGGHVVTEEEAAELGQTLGLLRLSGSERMFAIDGQHRADAIRKLLARKPSDPVREDQFPVLFVAHVDDAVGKKRSRKLFADINKRAVPVSRGDLAIIDEEDVNCIAARAVFASYAPLKKLVDVTERPETVVGESKFFTNLLTIVEVAKKLRSLYRKHPKTKPWDALNVAEHARELNGFFDFLLEHVPQLKSCLTSGRPSIATMRRDRKHLLFRPVGLVVAAEVYAAARKREKVDDYAEWLETADLALDGPLFQDVLWGSGKVLVKGRTVATKLVQNAVGMLDADGKRELTDAYRKFVGNPTARLPAVRRG